MDVPGGAPTVDGKQSREMDQTTVQGAPEQKESLGDRMKRYEKAMEQSLIPELPVVARLGVVLCRVVVLCVLCCVVLLLCAVCVALTGEGQTATAFQSLRLASRSHLTGVSPSPCA